ncbi:MAG: N-acetyl-gamma-glutamyl-phosphate reductase [Gammaproteobacteria bacterium]|nr:N-acetyl-gamma-glutamyl-phosphate reductase [Gammaproteobacteria bacterium]
MIRAGVLGASGYMGGEVIRVLLNHPDVELAWATSRQPGDIAEVHPNLYGQGIKTIHPDDITPCDVVFIALPTAATLDVMPHLLAMDCRVIDLGAAFRLKSQDSWESVYAQPHSQWSVAEESVYGINELHLYEISQARVIANPGCFASAAILALAPLIEQQLVDTQTLIVNGLSGTAGMGAELARPAHHPEIGNNLVPYNVVDHRHTYEMEQELGLLIDDAVHVHFTPTYVPITRGILNICHAFPVRDINRKALQELYRDYYNSHPFVDVYDLPKEAASSWQYKPYPWLSAVTGTNRCLIGFDIDEKRNRVVLFSVLDSLGKGGAQVGIENMNLMFGLDRTAGLKQFACHP